MGQGASSLIRLKNQTTWLGSLRDTAPGIKVSGIPALESYADYGMPLNVVLAQDDNIPKKDPDRIYSYLTTLPVSTLEDALRVYRQYRRRWDIENHAMKDLAGNWNFNSLPGGFFNLVSAHIFFTIAAFNWVMLFKDQGHRELRGHTIRTIRDSLFKQAQGIVFYAGEEFCFLTLDEIRDPLIAGLRLRPG